MDRRARNRRLVDNLLQLLKEGMEKAGFTAEPRWQWADTHVWLILEAGELGEIWVLKRLTWWEQYRDGHPDERLQMSKELIGECRMRLSVRSRKVLGPGH